MRRRLGRYVQHVNHTRRRHETAQAIPLLAQNLERMWLGAVGGDKRYSATHLRNWLEDRKVAGVILRRTEERGPNNCDRTTYRERTKIERTINRFNQYWRIATRYEQLASS